MQAGLKPNPTIEYHADDIGDEGSAGMHSLVVGQEIVTAGKLWRNRAVVDQEIATAECQWQTAQQRVLADVRSRFYEALIAQRSVEVARSLVDISNKAVETAQNLLDARRSSEARSAAGPRRSQQRAGFCRPGPWPATRKRFAAWLPRQVFAICRAGYCLAITNRNCRN